jgi:hypothetical protein
MLTDVRLLQPEKAELPIAVTVYVSFPSVTVAGIVISPVIFWWAA